MNKFNQVQLVQIRETLSFILLSVIASSTLIDKSKKLGRCIDLCALMKDPAFWRFSSFSFLWSFCPGGNNIKKSSIDKFGIPWRCVTPIYIKLYWLKIWAKVYICTPYIPIYEQKILNSKVKCVYLDSLAIKNVMFR